MHRQRLSVGRESKKSAFQRTAGASERRIVLLGKTGNGKSSTGNAILGERVFAARRSPRPVTQTSVREARAVNGRNITVVDTPGFVDPHISDETLRRAVVTCIVECAPGPHAFLIVLSTHRYTDEERRVIQEIRQVFGDNVLQYAILLFTGKDQLQEEGRTIEQFVQEDDDLLALIRECGGRYHAFNNKDLRDQTQVQELLGKIDDMVRRNGGGCYTNEMLQAIPPLNSEEERWSFINALLKELAGMGTGALLGAFYGVLIGCTAAVVLYGASIVFIYRKVRKNLVAKVAENILTGEPVIPNSSAVSVLKTLATTGLKVILIGGAVGGVAGGLMGALEGHRAASGAKSVSDAPERAFNAVSKSGDEVISAIFRAAKAIAMESEKK